MLPTYITIPLMTGAFFLAAILRPLLIVAHWSLIQATGFAILWVLLAAAMLRGGRFEVPRLLTGIVTLLLTTELGALIAARADWPPALGQVVFVLCVMAVFALIGLLRRRDA